MEEARAHLSNSWDLEVWAAATLQMHLSLRLEWRQALCRIRSALTGLDQLSASWTASDQAASFVRSTASHLAYNITDAVAKAGMEERQICGL